MLGQAIPRLRTQMLPAKLSMIPFSKAKKKFRDLKKLGQGSYGAAYSARLGSRKIIVKVAMATYVPMSEALGAMAREVSVLRKLQKFPFVPRLLEIGNDYFIQEDVGGESMLSLLTRKGLEAREILAVVVASGVILSRLHREGIAHTDFEARNILLSPDGVVAIDFGLAVDREADGDERFREGIKIDLSTMLSNIGWALEARDFPEPLRMAALSVVAKYEKMISENQIDELTADNLARDLVFILAQLGAAAKRGVALAREKVRVVV